MTAMIPGICPRSIAVTDRSYEDKDSVSVLNSFIPRAR